MYLRLLFLISALVLLASCAPKSEPVAVAPVDNDIIYGRKFGTALTMTVMHPRKTRNGCGLIWVVSGGWHSAPAPPDSDRLMKAFLDHGYTIFAVSHGAQPRYTVPDMVEDLRRAVRYIRRNAGIYEVRPDDLAIFGCSSGGHLALLVALQALPAAPDAEDPVNREPVRLKAVAAVAPPTDFFNYGADNRSALGEGLLKAFAPAFAFQERNQDGAFVPVDASGRLAIGKSICPVNLLTDDDPPVILFHGDSDTLVPIQQSRLLIEKLTALNVPCELHAKVNRGHDIASMEEFQADMELAARWLDKYVPTRAGAGAPTERN